MANIKATVSAHLSQRQRQINKEVERAEILDQDRLLCNIIRVSGNLNVPLRPGFVWCQEYSPSDDTSPFHAFNDKVQAREGLPVWVGPGLGGRREVLGWNNATIVNTADYAAQKYLPIHHSDHEWTDFKPGPDVVNVYPRSLSMLRTYPGEAGALTVSASPLRYAKGNALVLFPGKNSLDISAAQPASGLARFVGIYLDPDDNTLKSVNGATTGDSPTITPDSPSFPESAILSANVRLNGDQTVFSEVDMVDVRQILDSSGAIDGTRVSKLVSPDGLVDPVLSADNSGNVTLAETGTLAIPSDIIHAGDVDTKMAFTTDQWDLTVGGINMIRGDAAAQDVLSLGDVGGAGDVDINFNNGQMFLRGSDNQLDLAGNLLLSGGAQNYLITDRATLLAIQSQTSGANSGIELFAKDGDGTDFNSFLLYGVGTPVSIANRERLIIQYSSLATRFNVFTEADGTGTLRPLALYTEGNTDQMILGIDGDIEFNGGLEITTNDQTKGIIISDNETNNTNKETRFLLRHYDNTEEEFSFFGGRTTTSTNEVRIGGGYGVQNAATILRFFTAANNTTLVGTDWMTLISDGKLGVNGITNPSTELDIGGGAITFAEMTAPSNPAANETVLYAEDDSTVTRQQIKFSSGNAVTIAKDGGLQTYTPTNVVTDRSYDANATSVAELADVLGTLIADFQAAGVLG